MKNLSTVLMLLALSSAPVYAQHDKDSGSGNGTFNRSALDYEAELKEADLNLESLDQAFEKLKENIKALSSIKTPELKGEGSYWDNFSEEDRQAVLDIDDSQVKKLETFTDSIQALKKIVVSDQAKLNKMLESRGQYSNRDLDKKFKKFIIDQRAASKKSIEETIAKEFDALNPTTGQYSQRPWYTSNYGGPMRTSPETSFANCASAICTDMMTTSFLNFADIVESIGKMKIEIMGIDKTIKSLHGKIILRKVYRRRTQNTSKRLNAYRKDVQEQRFKRITTIHSLEIND